MRGDRGGKSVVKCEVCPDHVGHSQSIVVGHKASGVVRVIHDRARCRKRWARNKDSIMARWPELRRPAPEPEALPGSVPAEPVGKRVVRGMVEALGPEGARRAVQAVTLKHALEHGEPIPGAREPVLASEAMEHVLGAPAGCTLTSGTASAPVVQVVPVSVTTQRVVAVDQPAAAGADREGPMEKGERKVWRPKPALLQWLRERLAGVELRRGVAGRLYAALDAAHPYLLVDLNGRRMDEHRLQAAADLLGADSARRG